MTCDPRAELLAALPEASALLTSSGAVVEANARFAHAFGSTPAALAGTSIATRADDPAGFLAYLRMAARTRGRFLGALRPAKGEGGGAPLWRCEAVLVRPRREAAEALVLLRLLPREQALARFLELDLRLDRLDREIRRRIRTEEELRRGREWFRVTLASIGDAVIATDEQGTVTFMNPVAEALTGWRRAQAVGRPLGEVFRIVHETTRETVENPVQRVLAEGTVVGLANHTVLIARDGSETCIDDSAAPIRDAHGQVRGVVLVFRDVTERRRLEATAHERAARLAEADRRKDEFLAMLSHELRNPLAPIVNALELLDDEADEATRNWARAVLARQTRHLTRLVDDLLDVSRITLGKIQLRPESVDLSLLARRAIDWALYDTGAHQHELSVSIPEEALPLEADPTRLEQVIVNLLHNAIKFTPPGGRIEFELAREGDEAVLRVRDTGVGIEPEALPAIFELFSQGTRGLDRTQGGLGIGLTLVRRIVELHGGSVAATSRGSGTGSEFTVRLPLARGAPASPSPAAAGGADRLRVLVVDDNPDAADGMALLLGARGHRAETAHDGAAALARARAERPDVVLLDIGLPGREGYEVAGILRRELGPAAWIVAVTGYGAPEDRERVREAGFDAHLVKPVSLRALDETLAQGAATARNR